ncbi:MAG: hypothetical protein WCD24_13135 [Serratia inhibens]|uniref:hypothetical protein n=1 Tax=Serratia inhibens TaxID=2338073 RepID=UPI003C79ED53
MNAALPPEPAITITRTDYAGMPNEWRIEADQPSHCTTHRDIDEVLMVTGILMRRIEREQVQR